MVDPLIIIAGIRQFGLAPDGSDLRDLEAAIQAAVKERDEFAELVCRYAAERAPDGMEILAKDRDTLARENDALKAEAQRIRDEMARILQEQASPDRPSPLAERWAFLDRQRDERAALNPTTASKETPDAT